MPGVLLNTRIDCQSSLPFTDLLCTVLLVLVSGESWRSCPCPQSSKELKPLTPRLVARFLFLAFEAAD